MREKYAPKSTTERLAQWPNMRDRIKEILRLDESGGEPFFFITEDKEGAQAISPVFQGGPQRIQAPIAVMLNYLLPDLTEEDFSRITEGGGTTEEISLIGEKLGEIKGIAHFQPEGVIEPSTQDLEITQELFLQYSAAGISPPLQIIGRKNQEGKIDLLSLWQTADLPAPEIVGGLQNLVEKYVLLRALPGYLERNGEADQANQLRQALSELENKKFDEFIEKYKQIIGEMPNQEAVGNFRQQFRANFTVFPEYLSCVQEALAEFNCFETSITTIDPENQESV